MGFLIVAVGKQYLSLIKQAHLYHLLFPITLPEKAQGSSLKEAKLKEESMAG